MDYTFEGTFRYRAWHSGKEGYTQNWKVPGSNPAAALSQALRLGRCEAPGDLRVELEIAL